LGCIQAPRTSTQAETATNDGNGSVTTIKCGATRYQGGQINAQFFPQSQILVCCHR
jgi:hypothetical protein